MTDVQSIRDFLGEFAPIRLAGDWDNVGLLVGDPARPVGRVMTCLTVTPASASEALREQADLIVTHHPLPFRPLNRLTTETTPGRLLWDLIHGGVAIYSPHTAFDSAAAGINFQLAEGLGLEGIAPLVARTDEPEGVGAGRYGRLAEPATLTDVAAKLKAFLSLARLQAVGSPDHRVTRVAVACGAAGQFLDPARRAGCDLLVTGETNFHTCLEAEAQHVALLLPGHFASERFALETLAQRIAQRFPHLTVWASRDERDPLRWL
jgi:dinuclear metal center YbgI/SA1388 family protein